MAASWYRMRTIANPGDREMLAAITGLVLALVLIGAVLVGIDAWLATLAAIRIPGAVLLAPPRCTSDSHDRLRLRAQMPKLADPALGSATVSLPDGTQHDAVEAWPATASVELRDIVTGRLIRTYTCEGPALAFVRDVVRLGSREQAARFELVVVDESSGLVRVTGGTALVTRALEDSVLATASHAHRTVG